MLRRILFVVPIAAVVLALLPFLALRGLFGAGIQNWASLQVNAVEFNWIYAGHGTPFRDQPSGFLVMAMEGRQPGKALDVAMGQGRNAVYLAEKGWQVTGFDIAGQGLAVARASAASHGVPLQAIRASVENFNYGTEEWDLIVMTYVPVDFDNALLVERIRTALKPGGLILVEMPVERRLGPGQLRAAFEGFEFLHYGETSGMAEWYPRATRIANLLARKPL
jgi:2-polyprenyl-3-methyl-5-hydroxy-6-metoxy-1,4-benzoquinol methylase